MTIASITPSLTPAGLSDIGSVRKTSSPAAPGELSFSKLLDSLSKTQLEGDALMQKLAAGEDVELHQVMIASEETDISFRVAMAIRDKLVEAYHETMRMAV